jgi:phospholipid-binding lipoprotein MlaA
MSFARVLRSLPSVAVLLAAALLASGCAATPGRTSTDDPLQGFNRKVDKFNDTLDRAALKPVAKAYKKVTPHVVRSGVSNFFSNVQYPITIVNQFLQGKFVLGLRDTGRLLVNSTIGLGGLLDVASRMNMPANDEDFGQTLAVWGVPSGPYLVLPLFGPSNFRDGPARIPDFYGDALQYVEMPWEAVWGLRALDQVNSRAELLSVEQTLSNAYDRYSFLRDAWIQRREYNVFDGDPPLDDMEDLEDPEAGMSQDSPPEEAGDASDDIAPDDAEPQTKP